jgi:dTDP-4-dehydrorhamnose reductase
VRLLVTGAGGLLGSAVVRASRRAGWPVAGVGRRSPTGASVDLAEASGVDRLFATLARPDACVHCAGDIDIARGEQDPATVLGANVLTALLVARQCARRRIPMVLVSTDYVFDGSREAYSEESECRPVQAYGLSKYLGEQAVSLTADSLIVRLPLLYDLGENDRGFVAKILRQARRHGTAPVDHYFRRFPTHVDDAATAILELLSIGARGTVHVSARTELTKLELLRELAPVTGLAAGAFVESTDASGRELRPRRVRLECRRLAGLRIASPGEIGDVLARLG